MSSKFTDVISRVKDLKEVQPGKYTELENGDMHALLRAAFEVFAPVLLGMLVFFAVIIFILVHVWS